MVTAVRSVPLLDLTRMPPDLREELRAAFDRVLASGAYILGNEVTAFEEACARYTEAKFAVGVSSGTDALLATLMAVDVGPGDEVICPSYTFFATAGSIWRLGARPVFVDSLPCCFDCDPGQVADAITGRTKAILPVHLFGQCADMDPILEAAAGRDIPVIEDAAQAIGARYRGRGAGTMGKLGCFSFFPSKNLGGFGDGGLVTVGDEALAEKVRVLRGHGGKPKYHHSMVGGNFRLDALQAALLAVKLKRLDGYTERRRANAAIYTGRLTESGIAAVAASACRGHGGAAPDTPVILPPLCRDSHIYNQYVIRIPGGGRDRLRKHLADRKVGTEIYYPVPLHRQACFASLGMGPGSLPVAEAAADETLALPIFPELREEEIHCVCDAIIEGIRGKP